jgi:hypothetical protein
MFLTLADEGELAADQLSRPRKSFLVLAALLVFLLAPLYWVGNAQGSGQDNPQAVLVKASEDDDDEDDDDNDTAGNTETGNNDTGTGRETAAGVNTDRQAANTAGASTRGETDTGDNTGQTERVNV